jgi:transposase
LDVSLEATTICVVDDVAMIVRAARGAREPEVLVAFFEACGMKMERVGLEACSLTAWLHGGLTEVGIPAICIEARQAKPAMGAMPNKTDRNALVEDHLPRCQQRARRGKTGSSRALRDTGRCA